MRLYPTKQSGEKTTQVDRGLFSFFKVFGSSDLQVYLRPRFVLQRRLFVLFLSRFWGQTKNELGYLSIGILGMILSDTYISSSLIEVDMAPEKTATDSAAVAVASGQKLRSLVFYLRVTVALFSQILVFNSSQ